MRVAAGALTLAVMVGVPAHARASFELGLEDAGFTQYPGYPAQVAAYAALKQVAGSMVRIDLPWSYVAPAGATTPGGFDASNSADPHYRLWYVIDIAVKDAAAHHDRVILRINQAPEWAQGAGKPSCEVCTGDWEVNPSELGAFMHAAAERYSGHFPDPASPGSYLPHVSDWEIWNEQNLPESLMAPDRVESYRAMLNASYAAIKAVDPRAVVAVGGLAPVSFITGGPQAGRSTSPLAFAAQLFCLQRAGTGYHRAPSCPRRANFDVFAIHPYTLAATPTKHAYHYDDVLVGDMDKVSAIVRAADRLRTVGGPRRHAIWVTEWGWFTNPPNQCVGDTWMTAPGMSPGRCTRCGAPERAW